MSVFRLFEIESVMLLKMVLEFYRSQLSELKSGSEIYNYNIQ